MNMYEDCYVPIWRPVLKTFPVSEVLLALCVLFRASLSGRVTESTSFLFFIG